MQKRTKCDACAGDLEFIPTHNYIMCKKCGAKYPIKLDKSITQHNYDLEASKKKVLKPSFLKCASCGATVNAEDYALLDKCSYCGNTNFSQDLTKISADAILPFQFDKVEAKDRFKKYIAKKSLIPNALKHSLPKLEVEAKYFTAYVFNGNSKVGYSGTLEYRTEDSDGDTVYRTRHVKGQMDFPFINYMIEASDDMSQYDFNKIAPYNLSKGRKYSYEYVMGQNAEFADISPSQANEVFLVKLRKNIENLVCKFHNCDRVKDLDLSIEFTDKKYSTYLLPSYQFNFSFKEKKYINIMNGETGRITGNLPKSGWKIAFRIFISFLIVLAIVGVVLL